MQRWIRCLTLAVLASTAALVAGCGQKGDLYLPADGADTAAAGSMAPETGHRIAAGTRFAPNEPAIHAPAGAGTEPPGYPTDTDT